MYSRVNSKEGNKILLLLWPLESVTCNRLMKEEHRIFSRNTWLCGQYFMRQALNILIWISSLPRKSHWTIYHPQRLTCCHVVVPKLWLVMTSSTGFRVQGRPPNMETVLFLWSGHSLLGTPPGPPGIPIFSFNFCQRHSTNVDGFEIF